MFFSPPQHHQQEFANSNAALPPPQNPIEAREDERAISGEVMDMAHDRNEFDVAGNVDLSGLNLKQQIHDADGALVRDLEYVVDQRVVAKPKYERTGEKIPYPRKEGTAIILEDVGLRAKELSDEPELSSVIDLAVYEIDHETGERKLVSKNFYGSQEKFLAFLDSHDEVSAREKREKRAGKTGHYLPGHLTTKFGNTDLPRGPITGMVWGPEQPKPAAELMSAERQRVNIPLAANQKDVLEQVFQHREKMHLPGNSLAGLTLRQGGNIIQITDDYVLYSPDPDEPSKIKATRKFGLLEWNENGWQVSEAPAVYRLEGLRTLLNAGNYDDLHWEFPKKDWDGARPTRAVGRIAMHRVRKDGPDGPLEFVWGPDMGSRKLSLDEAYEVLCSPDLYDLYARNPKDRKLEEERFQAAVEEFKARPDSRKIAESLRRTIMRFGTNKVNETAEQLRDEYFRITELLGLPEPSPAESSISWALLEIAEQRYYAQHPDEAPPARQTDKFGIKIGDPLGRPGESRRKQREIIDNQIGLAIIRGAVKPRLEAKNDLDIDEDGSLKEKTMGVPSYTVNEAFLAGLQSSTPGEAQEAIEQFVADKNKFLKLVLKKYPADKSILTAFKEGKDVLPDYTMDRVSLTRVGRLMERQLQVG